MPGMFNPIRQQFAAPQGGAGFNRLAAGRKHYGAGGRSNPTSGKVTDMLGYKKRDAEAEARKQALLRRAGGF